MISLAYFSMHRLITKLCIREVDSPTQLERTLVNLHGPISSPSVWEPLVPARPHARSSSVVASATYDLTTATEPVCTCISSLKW